MSLGAQKPTATKMDLMPHKWECNHLLGGKCKPSFGGKSGYSSEDECNKACGALPPAPSPASYDPVWVCPPDTADPGMPSCVEVDKKSGVSKGQPFFKSRDECNRSSQCHSDTYNPVWVCPSDTADPGMPSCVQVDKKSGVRKGQPFFKSREECNSKTACKSAATIPPIGPIQPSLFAEPLCTVIDPKTNKETKQYCAAQALVCGFNALDPSKMTTLDKKRAASDTCVEATLFMAAAWESS